MELGNAGVLAIGRRRWLRALVWMVVLAVTVGISGGMPRAFAIWLGHGAPHGLARLASGVASVGLGFAVYWGLVRWAERRRAYEIGPAGAARDLVVGVAIGIGMFALVFASLRLSGAYTMTRGVWDDAPADVLQALATGLSEELIARAIIFRLLMRAGGPWVALAGSAVLFGGAHLGNPNATYVAAGAIAIEAGLMLAAFYVLTGRIWMSVGVHAAWNFAQGPVFGARVSGLSDHGSLFTSAPVPGTSEIFSGGAFGPEASLSAMIVGLAVFVVVILTARRRGLLSAESSIRII